MRAGANDVISRVSKCADGICGGGKPFTDRSFLQTTRLALPLPKSLASVRCRKASTASVIGSGFGSPIGGGSGGSVGVMGGGCSRGCGAGGGFSRDGVCALSWRHMLFEPFGCQRTVPGAKEHSSAFCQLCSLVGPTSAVFRNTATGSRDIWRDPAPDVSYCRATSRRVTVAREENRAIAYWRRDRDSNPGNR